MEHIKTICPYCGTGCGMILSVQNGQIKSASGDPDHPVNDGELCLKGMYGFEHVADRRRLTSPMIKRDGQFVRVSWDEALDFAANRLAEIKLQHGPDAFALFASARANNEDNYAAQKFTRAVMGTNNIDHCARICHSSTVAGLNMTLGSGVMTHSIPEIGKDSDVILIIGSNTAECHPLIARQVILAKQRGAKLIVIDPRWTDMANKADIFLRIPVGYNIPIINSLIHVILKEGLHKPEFIAQHTTGFDDMARAVEDYAPEVVEVMTSVSADQIEAAARLFAKANAATILYAMGITQFTHGTANVIDLSNLSLVTGQIGRPGAGIAPLRGQNNVQGACDLGALPNVYPGYLSVTDEANAFHFEKAWGAKLSRKPGIRVTEVPHAIEAGKLKTLFVFGENPLMSDPDSGELRHAFAHLDLMIVMDMFMTETARMADVVFPIAGWSEKEGSFINTERRIQRVRKAVNPPAGTQLDWWVFSELARRLGYSGMAYNGPEDIWNELRKVVPAAFGGISYARMEREPGVFWPCPDESHPGTPILYQGGKFFTPTGKGALYPVLFDPDTLPKEKAAAYETPIMGCISEHADAEYPFILTTGRIVTHYHTGTMTRKSTVLNQVAPEELIELNPEDAQDLAVNDGEYIRLETRRGHIVAKAKVTERIQPKMVFGTFHYWEACCNELTNGERLDPISAIPEFKISAVKVTKSSPAEAAEWLETIKAKNHFDQQFKGTSIEPSHANVRL